MKFVFSTLFVITTVALAYAETPEAALMSKVMSFNPECQKQYKISPFEMLDLTMMRVPKNRQVFCYMACMAKKLGVMTADNEMAREGITQIAAPFTDKYSQAEGYEKAKDAIETCIAELAMETNKSDECDVIKNAVTCAMTKGKQAGLIA